MGANLCCEGIRDSATGGVGDMDDTPVTVSAFSGEVVAECIVGPRGSGEIDPHFDEIANAGLTVFHHKAHNIRITQARTRTEGIVDVRIEGVFLVKDHGHAALGVSGVALHKGAFG